ncbi:MAG: 3-oxoacyl-[acyl-carrier-protein] reductase [Elusimicrobiales bacterium]
MLSFKEKTVLITGAADGIGKRTAEIFCELEANLVLMDVDPKVREVVERLREKNSKVFYFQGDVSVEDDCKSFIEFAVKNTGRIDVLINNAGITCDNLVIRMSKEEFSKVIDINLKGPFYLSKYAFIHMSKNRYGRIINISSIVGLTGQAGQANYASSKAGLIGLTKSLAREFSKRGITVNAVAPGFIETSMTAKLDEKTKQRIIDQIPLQRLGRCDDVAWAVVFLASELASYITGQVISVNGGLYM